MFCLLDFFRYFSLPSTPVLISLFHEIFFLENGREIIKFKLDDAILDIFLARAFTESNFANF